MRTTVFESGTEAEAHREAAPSSLPGRWGREVSASADRMAERMRRGKYVILFLFSILYFAVTCFRASQKLFWFDELFTLYLSRLPDLGSLWGALKQGVDLNPPLFYVITRFSQSLFGEGQIASRLPEIVGFWVFCLCLFRFVSARTSVLAGTIAMLFPMVTTAYYYAYEARPHGLVLGFAGVALVCWQSAIRSRRKAWWLIGLPLALLCAILSHTYAVLLVVPLALAELTRSLSLRRVDWAVWLTIISPLSGALLFLPLVEASKANVLQTVFPANLRALADSYPFDLSSAIGVFSLALVLYFGFTIAPEQPPAAKGEERSLELPESVALIAFAALPVFAILLANIADAPCLPRYSVSAVAGFGCLFGILAARKAPVGLSVLVFLMAQIAFSLIEFAFDRTLVEPDTSTRLSTASELEHEYGAIYSLADKTSPIVLFDSLRFLPIIHYAPPGILSRLVYSSPDVQINEEGFMRLQRCCGAPGRFERLADLVSTHDTFIALCSPASFFRLEPLIHDGADVKVENISSDNFLVSVTFRNRQRNEGAIPPR
jgi:hypothetical protein